MDTITNLPENPSLYILDHTLMKKNDVETYKEILKHDPFARVLFMSEDEKLKNRIKSNGNVGVLLKPFLLSTFMDAVKTMVFGPQPQSSGNGGIAVFQNE
jgi:DNA-binding NarL/FixJ family response regulator